MTRAYREDIDWLRAIAVLVGGAFHFEAPAVFGGFVGVDIFFVISGYLITGIIESGVCAAVLLRAVRRAQGAPAAAGAVRHGGADRDSVAALSPDLGTAGIFPLRRGGGHLHLELLLLAADRLFRPRGGGKPLLHTWSLAVEEQFYLALPLLLWALLRHGRGDGCGCRSR